MIDLADPFTVQEDQLVLLPSRTRKQRIMVTDLSLSNDIAKVINKNSRNKGHLKKYRINFNLNIGIKRKWLQDLYRNFIMILDQPSNSSVNLIYAFYTLQLYTVEKLYQVLEFPIGKQNIGYYIEDPKALYFGAGITPTTITSDTNSTSVPSTDYNEHLLYFAATTLAPIYYGSLLFHKITVKNIPENNGNVQIRPIMQNPSEFSDLFDANTTTWSSFDSFYNMKDGFVELKAGDVYFLCFPYSRSVNSVNNTNFTQGYLLTGPAGTAIQDELIAFREYDGNDNAITKYIPFDFRLAVFQHIYGKNGAVKSNLERLFRRLDYSFESL